MIAVSDGVVIWGMYITIWDVMHAVLSSYIYCFIILVAISLKSDG